MLPIQAAINSEHTLLKLQHSTYDIQTSKKSVKIWSEAMPC